MAACVVVASIASCNDGDRGAVAEPASSPSDSLLELAAPEFTPPQSFLASASFQKSMATTFNTGKEVPPDQYSWQIGLRVRGKTTRCGAILVSPDFVLTAAHCVDSKPQTDALKEAYAVSELEAFAASSQFGATPIALDAAWPVQIHDSYKAAGPRYHYDAALLKLAAPLTGATPAPVGRTSFVSGPAITSGWGDHPTQGSERLRAVTVPVVAAATCRAGIAASWRAVVTDATICTVDRAADSCGRDSGGPLVVGPRSAPQTIGIVSWGYSAGCGLPLGRNLVGGYTRASSIADWVVDKTGEPATATARPFGPLMAIATPNDR